MNKKIIMMTLAAALFAGPAYAQYMGPHDVLNVKGQDEVLSEQKLPQLDNHLTRAIIRRVNTAGDAVCEWLEEQVYEKFGATFATKSGYSIHTYDWARLVTQEENHIHRTTPLGSSCYAITTPSFTQKPLHQNAQEYSARFRRIQTAMKQNAVLKNYKLVVPNPDDLVLFDQEKQEYFKIDMDYLVNWLERDTSTSRKNQIECSRQAPGVVGVSFTKHSPKLQVIFNLWIDARAKKVYFLRNGEYYGEIVK